MKSSIHAFNTKENENKSLARTRKIDSENFPDPPCTFVTKAPLSPERLHLRNIHSHNQPTFISLP